MKRYLLIMSLLIIIMITSCSPQGQSGALMQGQKESWIEPTPYGMVFIPRGSIRVGPSDEDPTKTINPTNTVSIDAFWMDDTEITNWKYKQFINWVKDSTALKYLYDANSGPGSPWAIFDENNNYISLDYNAGKKIDWNGPDSTTLEPIFLPPQDRFFGKKEIDTRKLAFKYYWIDLQKAAQRSYSYDYKTGKYRNNADSTRHQFINEKTVPIYPDTLCWIRDFTYSFNEPWTMKYLWHPGFNDYPVVGVTWEQANAFCQWRSKMQDRDFANNKQVTVQAYRLPSEFEWEFAARGGLQNSMFPWGGYYSRNQAGQFMANYKPLRGNYSIDGGLTTMKVASYAANDFGLYDMAGNVAEWTVTAYDALTTAMVSELNPDYQYNAKESDPPAMKRKVIRGGSWKDIGYYIQTSTRTYEYQDSSKCYIGFRCVRSSFGNNF